jgi:hypothetical protein
MKMTKIQVTLLVGALLLAAPAFAEEAHHPAEAAPETSGSAAPAPAPQQATPGDMTPGGMMMPGMMSGDMMQMMMRMMSGGQSPMMGEMGRMGPIGSMGPTGQMMSPEHVEGRIAFLKTELQVTEAQQPLWDALAEAIRASSGAADGMMSGMQGGMPMGAGAATAPQRIEAQEKALAARLESLRPLKAALEPFYAGLDAAQKEKADKLLVPAPMGMM